ncbi:hypothetical protein KAFR_0F02270 [Kazachstania africana CBS 2517]|uniref:PH domain-containing protein n=1 Tax=Kazachstania africana (strain ATCC 22294 / BCRC 22015 / CBS 2517 / CECT 1963 / NBRC 1671 / NRRL Y-8276) TaxID=1071382 RepID=H2AWS4_KAZAF|nr:hypothetical protein KAFR_0F02270 [Kazachstania africana CBS 2517]CCF58824.1 hypothetical protein KAFR_0F02270 [Kazachstania africana CBS 2517]
MGSGDAMVTDVRVSHAHGILSKPLLKLKLLELLSEGNFENLQQFIDGQLASPPETTAINEVLPFLLHFAVQVASFRLVKEIISHWSSGHASSKFVLDLNRRDKNGHTPLHLAAAQSRMEVINFLLEQSTINEMVTNNQNLLPFEMCKNLNVAQSMQIKRSNYILKTVTEFQLAFNKNDTKTMELLLNNPRNLEFLDVNNIYLMNNGKPLLLIAIEHNNLDMCKWLFKHDADPNVKSLNGVSANDQIIKSNNAPLKKIFDKYKSEQSVVSVTNKLDEPPTFKGYLKKFTNFAQGYKLRYFVLSENGKLSYYKDQNSSIKKSPRGQLDLSTCYLHLDSTEKLKFEIVSNDSSKWQLKGNHPMETNKWIWAIQRAIRYTRDKKKEKRNGNNVTPSSIINPVPRSPKKSLTSPSFPARHLHDLNRTRTVSAQSRTHNNDTMSIASNDVELSNNLTESGKNYVNKMIETRLESSPVSDRGVILSPISQAKSLDDAVASNESSGKNSLAQMKGSTFMTSTSGISYMSTANNDIQSVGPLNIDSEEEEEEGGINLKFEKDEEFLKVEYGPYIESLNLYQKKISLEINSLNELLNDSSCLTSQVAMDAVKKSLSNVLQSILSMNGLSLKRDEKLVSMLTKQRDINNVWIQSVRDLEIELMNKTERLDALDRERKNLKKSYKQRLVKSSRNNSNGISSDNVSSVSSLEAIGKERSTETLKQIATFLSATKNEDENSEGDEFFDAEELLEELNEVATGKGQADVDEPISVATLQHPLSRAVSMKSEQESPEKLPQPSEDEEAVDTLKHAHTDQPEKTIKSIDYAKPKAKKVPQSIPDVRSIAKTKAQVEKAKILSSQESSNGYEDGIRKRLRLDKDNRPRISLWAVLKSMVGKDMTRMTLPVAFNEPTSLLQRVAEDLEFSELLTKAATFEDSTLRLLYVSVFTASCYASTTGRVAKPFNPLLGETYEYVRPDKHYRFFTEQVSHHPPISATWTESPKWDFWGESQVDTKFNGRTFGVKHLGIWYVKLRPDCNNPMEELYTYKKPDNTVIGILLGHPEVDNHGEVRIVNHTTGDYCLLNFKARGWRSSGAFEVRGEVFDKNNQKKWVLGGHWNDSIYAKKVTSKGNENMTLNKVKSNGPSAASPTGNEPQYDGSKFLIWKAGPRPEAPFNLTPFAITLNAPQPKLLPWLAPTDTRLRPDQRAMEDGEYDKAANEKHRVEEKQRAVRRYREKNNIEYQPRWFVKTIHPITKLPYWQFKGDYWDLRKQNQLSGTGDIF